MSNKEKKPSLKDLAEAAQKQGFKLEFETYAVLREYFNKNKNLKEAKIGINFPVNAPFSNMGSMQTNYIYREIDVYGSCSNNIRNLAYHFLIECKGTSNENKLLLINETDSVYHQAVFTDILLPDLSIDGRLLMPGTNTIIPSKKNGPLYTLTGDFFHWNNKEYKQIGKNEDANNLFKAIRQLNVATESLINNRTLRIANCKNILVPMIVTNADICIMDFEANEIFTAPWILYRNRIEGEQKDIGYMPYIIITSLANLMDCLNGSSYKYKNWEKTPIKLN